MSDARTTEEKVAAYRQKFPERVAKLRAVLLPLMGIHARTKLSPEALEAMSDPHLDAVITACWGLND